MAYGNPNPNPGTSDDEDLYESSGDKKEGAEYDEGKDQSAAATLPRAILAGKKFDVGDEVIFKITHMGDEEITVMYAPEEKEEEHADDKEPMPEAPKGEAAMASTGGDYE